MFTSQHYIISRFCSLLNVGQPLFQKLFHSDLTRFQISEAEEVTKKMLSSLDPDERDSGPTPLLSDEKEQQVVQCVAETNGIPFQNTEGLGDEDDSIIDRCSVEEVRLEKRKIMKNIYVISLAFLLIYHYGGLFSLQSSLNRVEGMGVITSSVNMATMMLSCMFLPKIVINCIGHKWTMALSFWGFILYIAANGYAVWATMITANILLGACAATLWTAQCSYFTIIGGRYANWTRKKPKQLCRGSSASSSCSSAFVRSCLLLCSNYDVFDSSNKGSLFKQNSFQSDWTKLGHTNSLISPKFLKHPGVHYSRCHWFNICIDFVYNDLHNTRFVYWPTQ